MRIHAGDTPAAFLCRIGRADEVLEAIAIEGTMTATGINVGWDFLADPAPFAASIVRLGPS
jgi:hypothetical protein